MRDENHQAGEEKQNPLIHPNIKRSQEENPLRKVNYSTVPSRTSTCYKSEGKLQNISNYSCFVFSELFGEMLNSRVMTESLMGSLSSKPRVEMMVTS